MGGVAPSELVPPPDRRAQVTRGPRGGPGDIALRLTRAERLLATEGVATAPLALLVALLRHHQLRAADDSVRAGSLLLAAGVGANLARDRFPLFDLDGLGDVLLGELDIAVDGLAAPAGDAMPEPLAEAGRGLQAQPAPDRRAVIETWLDDPSLVDPRMGFWVQAAAMPMLEAAAVGAPLPSPEAWRGGACPLCGGLAQVSVIAEESGEFMGGSPRSLVCGRCAAWWSFPRAMCALCGESDPRNLASYVADGRRWARIDACETCHGYVKTFDLREDDAAEVVPLVDDVATLVLDVWALERGIERTVVSVAGV
ncbi:MAG TPA: formate dehydrogenase accessory protein FdhE [Acidimicrobiales bacterium]|nr:formate dehydrogenase accessory protein FdhE [Acidimicrobiales bacterium]